MRKVSWFLVGLFYYFLVADQPPIFQSFAQTHPTLYTGIALSLWSAAIAFACSQTWKDADASPIDPKIRRLTLAGLASLVIQYALGSLSRLYQSGLICPNFPNCQDQFLPSSFTLPSAVTFFHRWWGILMLGLFIHLTIVVTKRAPHLLKPTRQAMTMAIAQVFLGIGLVMSQIHSHSRALHVWHGYAIWGILFYLAMRARVFHKPVLGSLS